MAGTLSERACSALQLSAPNSPPFPSLSPPNWNSTRPTFCRREPTSERPAAPGPRSRAPGATGPSYWRPKRTQKRPIRRSALRAPRLASRDGSVPTDRLRNADPPHVCKTHITDIWKRELECTLTAMRTVRASSWL